VKLTTDFTVLADPPADLVTLTPDPTKRGVLLAGIKARQAVLRPDSEYVNVMIDCEKLPVSLAFDAAARIGDEEIPLGTMTLPKNEKMSFGMGTDLKKLTEKHGRPKRLTIILRSSLEAAKRSVEIYDAWEGELVFEDVPVSEKW
jgi:hypothetical protein